MEAITLTFFAVLGALIGSFLNVVILRHNTGRGIGGRSSCPACEKKLSWYELVPVISFVFQKGKCLGCKCKISYQYILVEISTALVFALAAWRELSPFYRFYSIEDIAIFLLSLISFSLLIVIFVYDYHHKIIPDKFSFAFAVAAILRLIVVYQDSIFSFPNFLDLAAGPILALPFLLIWLFSKGKWMGLGDAKLALGIGWFLGLSAALSAIALAFWIGAAVSIGILLIPRVFSKKKTLSWTSEIPFAPFLIIGLVVIYAIPLDFFHLNTFLLFL